MMSRHDLEELRQRMEVMVVTYFKMNGCKPGIEELYEALGSEYAPVLAEYRG